MEHRTHNHLVQTNTHCCSIYNNNKLLFSLNLLLNTSIYVTYKVARLNDVLAFVKQLVFHKKQSSIIRFVVRVYDMLFYIKYMYVIIFIQLLLYTGLVSLKFFYLSNCVSNFGKKSSECLNTRFYLICSTLVQSMKPKRV